LRTCESSRTSRFSKTNKRYLLPNRWPLSPSRYLNQASGRPELQELRALAPSLESITKIGPTNRAWTRCPPRATNRSERLLEGILFHNVQFHTEVAFNYHPTTVRTKQSRMGMGNAISKCKHLGYSVHSTDPTQSCIITTQTAWGEGTTWHTSSPFPCKME
ncbi:hypothetical protein BC826DRAFT_1016224, partial [Russula brevipes]